VPRPSPEDAREEDFLRLVARRDLVWHADRALRALAAGCAEAGCDLPRLRAARVTETEFQVFLAEPAQLSTPWVRTADEAVWVCPFDEIAALTPPDPFVLGGATPEDPLRGVQAPYPALVCVGQDAEGGHLLVDLEQIGTLGLVGPTDVTWEAMAAMSVELSTSTWADDLSVTTIDGLWGVEDIYHTGCLRHVRRLGPLLEPLSRRAADDRAAFATAGLEPGDGLTELHRARLRGSAADAVYPEILVLVGPTTPVERARLRGLLTEQPRVALAAVTTSTDLMGDYRLEFQDDGQAILHPFGIQITPQRLPRPVLQAMGRVIAVADQVPGQPPDEPPPPIDDGAWAELVAELEQNPDTDLVVSRLAGRPRGPASPGDPLGEAADDFAGGYPELATVAATVGAMAADAGPLTMPRPSAAPLIQKARQKARKTRTMIPGAKTSPYVRVLGPVVATGTTNLVEPSKINRLTEYLAYLVLNPDAKPASVDEAIWPDRPRETNASTRNTATSKLRRWLGVNESGQWHLPPFSYACASVGCDWKDWTALVGGKPLSHVSTQNLEAALALVRGRPFEGINNRGYRWADRLRQDMTIAINDVALELARRRFDAHDYRGAEQALATALNVSPGDEALWRLRISTCHAGGDHEGERAAIDGVCLIASELGCDLEDATVDLIEQLRREHRPGRR
jgi:DNA-binding SARP family transcriptional activator